MVDCKNKKKSSCSVELILGVGEKVSGGIANIMEWALLFALMLDHRWALPCEVCKVFASALAGTFKYAREGVKKWKSIRMEKKKCKEDVVLTEIVICTGRKQKVRYYEYFGNYSSITQ